MYVERYQLFSKGQLKNGVDKNQFIEFLRNKLGIDSSKAELLISGQSTVIKNDLSLEDLKKYYKVFGASGLDVVARVVMDKESFISALVEADVYEDGSTHEQYNKAASSGAGQIDEAGSTIYVQDLKKIKPVIFAGKGKLDVTDEAKNKKYLLDNNGFSIGSLMLLAAVVFASLELQSYVVKLLTFNYGLTLGATLVSLLVLIIGLACLPVLLEPLRRLDISSDNNALYSIEEVKGINLFNKKYDIYVNSVKKSLLVRHRYRRYGASCVSRSGETEYYISKNEQSAYQQAGEASKDVSMDLADLGIMEYLDYWDKIKKIYKSINGSQNDADIMGMDEFAFVYNKDNELTAKLYLSTQLAIEYTKGDLIEEEEVKILSLALVAAGVK